MIAGLILGVRERLRRWFWFLVPSSPDKQPSPTAGLLVTRYSKSQLHLAPTLAAVRRQEKTFFRDRHYFMLDTARQRVFLCKR